MSKISHAHYEVQDPEISFFIVKAYRGSAWPKPCLLATGFAKAKNLIYKFTKVLLNGM